MVHRRQGAFALLGMDGFMSAQVEGDGELLLMVETTAPTSWVARVAGPRRSDTVDGRTRATPDCPPQLHGVIDFASWR